MLVIITALISIIHASSDANYFSRITSRHGRGFEPKGEFWQGTPDEVQKQREAHELMRQNLNYSSYDFNVRVTQGMYSRGYGKVRLSVVTTDSRAPSGISWDFSSEFAWPQFNGNSGWQGNYLHSKIVDVKPGQNTHFTIDGNDVRVKIPASGKATRAYLFADPCFTQNQYCAFGQKRQVFNRHTDMLNYLSSSDQIDWWMIGGDNFYDQTQYWTKQFFSALNTDAKSTLPGMVMGNHDYWNNGNPGSALYSDGLGIGMTQYYAQDVVASILRRDNAPFDWSKNPWNQQHSSPPPVAPENHIFWYKVGNMGVLGYSGAFTWDQYKGYVDQSCQQFSNDQDVKFLVVVGHWDANDQHYGNQWNMDAPTFLESMKKLSSCSSFKYRMKYVDGHDHTNKKYDTGFKIGANGFSGSGQAGFLYLKTDDSGRFWAYYIEFESYSGNYFDATFNCVKSQGLDNCLTMPGVYVWYDSGPPLDPSCYAMLQHECTVKGQTATCGDRINWLESNRGMTWEQAYEQVVSDCGSTCTCNTGPTPKPGPTPGPTYGPCSDMLTRSACDHDGCHSCGSRIQWLEQNKGMTPAQAFAEVAKEFPGICQCDDPPKNIISQVDCKDEDCGKEM